MTRRSAAARVAVLAAALLGLATVALEVGASPLAQAPQPRAAAYTEVALAPEADAYVTQVEPDETFGTNIFLRVDGKLDLRSYLRFRVPDIGSGRTLTNATLRVYATSNAHVGYDVRAAEDNGWDEKTVTYRTAPHVGKTETKFSGPFPADTWTSVDVTSLVQGPGVLDLVMSENHRTAIAFASRETPGAAPQLVLTTAVRTLLGLVPGGPR
jgi:hypothetical protein